jgi:hypothetical protein
MTDFTVKLSDGRSVVVDAPNEQAARDAAKNYLMRQGKAGVSLAKPVAQPEPDPGIARATEAGKAGGLGNWVRSNADTLSFSGIDEAKASVQSAMPGVIDLMNKPGPSWLPEWLSGNQQQSLTPRGPDAYDKILAEDRAQSKAYAAEYPWWDASGKITGGVTGLSSLRGVPKVGPLITGSSPSLVGGMARSAVAGGGLSVPYGFGAGEGGFDERMDNAGKHGAIGFVGGLGLHPLLAGGGALTNAVVEGPLGRFAADRVLGPGVRLMGDVVDRFAPKVVPKSLSAAAPEGGSVAADSVLGRVSEAMTGAAPNSQQILDNAAARRIATALQRGGDTTASGQQTLVKLGPDAIPADINPMTQRQLYTVTNTPGGAAKVTEENLWGPAGREARTQDRVVGSVKKALGDSQEAVLEAQRLQGLRAGGSNYDDAIGPNAKYVVSPEMQALIDKAPAIRTAMKNVEEDAAKLGQTLTPAQIAHRVKRQLAADADRAYGGPGLRPNKADIGNLADDWRAALHDANPDIKAADAAWQAGSKRIEALELGRKFMASGTGETADAVSPAILEQRLKTMSAEEAQAFIDGASDTMIGIANKSPKRARGVAIEVGIDNRDLRRKLEAFVGKDNVDILYNRAMSEKKFAQTHGIAHGGSSSGRNLAAMGDEAATELATGGIPTSPTGVVQKLLAGAAQWYAKQSAGNEAVRTNMAKMLTEMDPVQQAQIFKLIEADLARRQLPRTVQRAVVPSLTGQVE